MSFEGVNEMIWRHPGGVLDTKVINNKGELDSVSVMLPQPWNYGTLVVSSFVEALL